MEKITTEKLKLINRERDDMDLKANARSEMERTSSLDDTMTLVAAVAYGKGLRGIPMQTMPPGTVLTLVLFLPHFPENILESSVIAYSYGK